MGAGFIFDYFCRPIIDSGVQGYNPVNTLTYAAIMFIIAVYGVYPFLKKIGAEFNFRFVASLLPFILFGSSFRVLNDMGFFQKTCNPLDPNFFTFTPGIWLLTAALTIGALLIAKRLAKTQESFYAIFAGLGLLASLPIVAFEVISFKAWIGFGAVIAATGIITLAAKLAVETWKKGFSDDRLNVLVVAGQALDGSATYVATQVLNCGEQHPLSSLLLGVNPLLFIIAKVTLAILIIHYIDKDVEDKNFAGFAKTAIAILGFAPGLRDLLTLAVGTCT